MSTRMDRYNLSTTTASRSAKNEHLYNTIDDINVDFIDIDNAKEIEINTSNNTVSSREDYRKFKGLDDLLGDERHTVREEKQPIEPEITNKVYDINDLLKKARDNKLFEEDNKKRYINTEYNILTKLDLEHLEQEKEAMKKENLKSLIDTIYSNTLATDMKKTVNEDKTLLGDLMQTKVELEPEISKEILDPDATTKVVPPRSEKRDDEKEQLADLINKTFIGTGELLKQDEKEQNDETMTKTEDFTDIDSKDSKLTVIIVILSVLAVLAVVGVIVAKKLGAF